jgi:hypothetical protein
MKRLFQISLASLLLTACGDGPNLGPAMAPTQIQQDAINQTEGGLVALAKVDVNGPAAAEAAILLPDAATLLFEPAGGASLGGPGLTLHGDARMPGAEAVVRTALLADCLVMNPDSIVWDQCIEDGITIDGAIHWGPGHVDVDLHIFGSISGISLDETMNSSLAVSASAIEGEMTLRASGTGGGRQLSETLHTEIDVQVADGCITTGTFTATASGSGAGTVNGAVQIVWSSCQMALIRKG